MFRSLSLSFLVAAACIPALAGAAGPPVLLADTNTRPASPFSRASGFIDFQGGIYFLGTTQTSGMEMWKTDGTNAGTRRVKEFKAGQASGFSGLVDWEVWGDKIIIAGQVSANEVELWSSDGTAEGTVRIKSMSANSTWAWARDLTEANGLLFFMFHDGLWRTDGTEAGTWLLKTGGFQNLTAYDGRLICQGNDAGGQELWRSDGTVAGTVRIKDIAPGAASSYPGQFTATGSGLYFNASVDHVDEIWKTDGTAEGTVRAVPDSGRLVAAVGDELYHVRGNELWRTDGTEEGNEFLAELPGFSSSYGAYWPCTVGSTLFFTDGSRSVWKTDGTEEGTALVKEVQASQLTALNGVVYFSGGLYNKARLWRSDGTPEGTAEVTPPSETDPQNDPGQGVSFLRVIGDTLYYSASYDTPPTADGQLSSRAMWKSDGTATGTVAFNVDISTEGTSLGAAVDAGGVAYFTTHLGFGTSIWRTDGTAAGTSEVPQQPAREILMEFTGAGGKAFITWRGDDESLTLSTYDGAGNPVILLQETAGWIHDPVESGGLLYFLLQNDITGPSLWKSDGTATGTVLVKQLTEASPQEHGPQLIPRPGGGLYLVYDDPFRGVELWKTDGTAAGTTRVKDIHRLATRSAPRAALAGDILHFMGRDDLRGAELWRSDGTAAGTQPLADLMPGPAGSSVSNLTASADGVYFLTYDPRPTTSQTLWKSDGTAEGTVALINVNFPVLTVAGNRAFFRHDDPASGQELWTSDGTPAGTRRVKDILPGPGGSDPGSITAHRGVVYFRANDGIHGEELWRSDGTEEGTYLAADITGDAGGGFPDSIQSVGQRLFFSAVTDTYGTEPYAYDPSQAPAILPGSPVAVTPHGAVLRGTVNAGGLATAVTLEYGTTPAYGTSATIPLVENNLLIDRAFSVPLTGLTPGTLYHYRYTAVNDLGQVRTTDATFTTQVATPLNVWLEQHDALGGAGGDKDGDGVKNVLEFAFGTDPADARTSALVETAGTLVTRGTPVVRGSGGEFRGLFVRRKDRSASGLDYTPQFSADLVEWIDATMPPQILTGGDADHELLSYPAPVVPIGPELRFFRVKVEAP